MCCKFVVRFSCIVDQNINGMWLIAECATVTCASWPFLTPPAQESSEVTFYASHTVVFFSSLFDTSYL